MALRIVTLRYVLHITGLLQVQGYNVQGYVANVGGTLMYKDQALAHEAARTIEVKYGKDYIVDVEEIEVAPEENDGSY